MVEVTQADRDLLAFIVEDMGLLSGLTATHIRNGGYDEDCASIARHRLATEAAKDAEIEKMADAFYKAQQTTLTQKQEIAELVALLREFMPAGVSLTNKNVPDTVTLPLDITMGELRKLSAALAKHGGCDE